MCNEILVDIMIDVKFIVLENWYFVEILSIFFIYWKRLVNDINLWI